MLDEINEAYHSRKLKIKSSKLYGMMKIFKEYYNLPNFITDSFHLDHGVPLYEEHTTPPLYSYQNKPLIFLTTKFQEKIYQKFTSKKTIVIGALFPKYRRMKSLRPKDKRQGTLVFPIHSTYTVDCVDGWEDYANMLEDLPSKFKPITICVYWLDIIRNRHEVFEKRGFEIVTCGHYTNENFVDRFYKIISQYKYATSNEHGSYLPYCVDFGIPFFIYGNRLTAKSIGDQDYYPEGEFQFSKEFGYYKADMISEAFKYQEDKEVKITESQKKLVDQLLNVEAGLDKKQIRRAVFRSQLQYFPLYLKHAAHKLFWDFIMLFPNKVEERFSKFVKPYYNNLK